VIDPKDTEIDIDDMRDWLNNHKAETNMSWSQLAASSGTKTGTLSQFGGGTYKGDNQNLADIVFRYRQNLTVQSQLKIEAPEIPDYFETKTSKELMRLLSWAQRGRMTFCAGGPGIGKTITAQQYRASVSNVFLVTMLKSINTVPRLGLAVMRAMGDTTARAGNLLTGQILSKLRGSEGLLIFDDAQILNIDQVEEIRGWYDTTGIGVAFLGNEQVVARMEGGTRKAEFAQLYSRIGMRMHRNVPLLDDIIALAEEWRIADDERLLKFLKAIGQKPGGLRSCTFALEIADMIAKSQGKEMSFNHLSSAYAQLNVKPVVA
jgi:DNA transposition AAA+ family ATPase